MNVKNGASAWTASACPEFVPERAFHTVSNSHASCTDEDVEERQKPTKAVAQEVRQQLMSVDLSSVMQASADSIEFCLDPWLPKRHVTLLGGHGGIGKSTMALALAAHVAAGVPFAGMKVRRSPVLFVSLEDEPMIVRLRLRRVIEAFSLPADDVIAGMQLLDGTETYSTLMTSGDSYIRHPHFTQAYQELLSRTGGVGMVVIDNASDAFQADVNSRQEVRMFMRGLSQIARERNAAVLLLAHIDKHSAKFGSQGNSFLGSVEWHNTSRSRIALVHDDGAISVQHEKGNLTARAAPLQLIMNDHGVPMPAGTVDTVNATGKDDESDQQGMILAMKAAAESGINVPANLTPGAYSAMSSLSVLPEYSAAFKGGKAGRSRAAVALADLLRKGLIIKEVYRKPNRHAAERFILAGNRSGEYVQDVQT